MKRILSVALAFILVLGLCACGGKTEQKAEPKTFRVGFSRVNITPSSVNGLAMEGYKDQICEGIFSYIMATCVAITDEQNNTLLLYTVDKCESERETIAAVRERLTKSTGIPGDNITLCATHTHTSIKTSLTPDYIDQLVAAGEEALKDRAPATIQAGSYDVPNMNFVRHYIMNDGTYKGDNFGTSKSGYKSHTTDADPNMRLIRFVREGNKKDVLMVNWQVHPRVASSGDTAEGRLTRNQVSSDFIGFARDHVEANEDVLMAYYTGASGNLNANSNLASERNLAPLKPDLYGKQFGDHVIAALENLQPVQTGSIGSKKAPLAAGGFYLHAYTVGSLGFATVPAEIFDTTGMQIRQGSPCDITFVLSCANGRNTYIPPTEVFDYASTGIIPYEVSICRYPQGTAETLAQDLVNMLKELNG